MKNAPAFRFGISTVLALTILIGGLFAGPGQGQATGKEMVYVFNMGSKDVSVIDPATHKVVRTHPLGVSVKWLSNEQNYWDGRRIWTYAVEGGISYAVVIDPAKFHLVKKIRLGKGPSHAAELAVGNRYAFVNVAGENDIAVIDTTTLEVVRRIPTGKFPCDLDTTPDSRFLFTPERNQDTVAQIDLGTFTVVNRVALEKGSLPHMLRVSPDGRRVWVQNRKAHTNVFLEVEPFRVLKTIRVDKVPVTNAFTPDGRHSYVTNKKGGTVSVVDTKSLEEVLRFKVGPGPTNIGFTADGRLAYISLGGKDAVAVIDARAHKLLKHVPVGKVPSGLLITDRFGK